jgi:Xaa-Pro aminopeptidase
MDASTLDGMQEAIRTEGLDGWLFCNFRHRDALADEILAVDPHISNSRLWLYAVPAEGEPCCIVSRVEEGVLGDLPGKRLPYTGRGELFGRLAGLAGKRWGVHMSTHLAAVSWLDAGTAANLEEAGLRLVSAAGLVQRFKGLLDKEGFASHERAAAHLYETIPVVWEAVRRAFAGGETIRERDVQDLFLAEFGKRNLETDHPPIVAAGANAGDPHYGIREDAAFKKGDVIQFDIWARERTPAGKAIWADISWVGYYGGAPSSDVVKAFGDLVSAREAALAFIQDELAAGRRPSGAAVDRAARRRLIGLGYEGAIRHRTGHGIDTEVHGSGVNIDSVEFPDERLLLDGSCFSLEPGIYFERYGLRTEIDVCVRDGKAAVSGGDRQFALLHC